jgi:hypothetical protein
MTLPNGSSAERYAHTLPDRPPADWETLADHLNKVKDSASNFAEAFGARPWGEVLGLCHDLGKLSDKFQLYLQKPGAESADAGSEEEDPRGGRVDHSTFGARFVAEAVKRVPGQLLAFVSPGIIPDCQTRRQPTMLPSAVRCGTSSKGRNIPFLRLRCPT